jgi:hypothetical protein
MKRGVGGGFEREARHILDTATSSGRLCPPPFALREKGKNYGAC